MTPMTGMTPLRSSPLPRPDFRLVAQPEPAPIDAAAAVQELLARLVDDERALRRRQEQRLPERRYEFD